MIRSDVKVTTSYKTQFKNDELIVNVKKVVRSESDSVTRIKLAFEIFNVSNKKLNEIIVFVRKETCVDGFDTFEVNIRRKAAKVPVVLGEYLNFTKTKLIEHLHVFGLDYSEIIDFIVE